MTQGQCEQCAKLALVEGWGRRDVRPRHSASELSLFLKMGPGTQTDGGIICKDRVSQKVRVK